MTRNPALRPSRAPRNRNDLHESALRIVTTAAAGFSAVFLAFALIWR